MTDVLAKYIFRDVDDDEFYLDVYVNEVPYTTIGPFSSKEQRQHAFDELLQNTRSMGAIDVPIVKH